MNAYLLGFVATIYLWTGWNYLADGRTGMALAFLAYALANFGFMWDLWQQA